MPRFALVLLIAAVSAVPSWAQETKTSTVLTGKGLAAAVAAVMPLDQQVNDFTNSMAETLPKEKQAVFKGIMKKNIDIGKLRLAATDALLKTYTEKELRMMYDFYAQPEAQEIMRKLSVFGEAMQPTVEVMIGNAVKESQKAGIFPAQ